MKRPSITNRAKKWASDVKQSTQSIRLARNRGSQSVSRVLCFFLFDGAQTDAYPASSFQKVEVVGSPSEAISNPFAPRAGELPRTPADSVIGDDEGTDDRDTIPPPPISHDGDEPSIDEAPPVVEPPVVEPYVEEPQPVASSSKRRGRRQMSS